MVVIGAIFLHYEIANRQSEIVQEEFAYKELHPWNLENKIFIGVAVTTLELIGMSWRAPGQLISGPQLIAGKSQLEEGEDWDPQEARTNDRLNMHNNTRWWLNNYVPCQEEFSEFLSIIDNYLVILCLFICELYLISYVLLSNKSTQYS